jgi:hypothetical protein
VKNRVLADPYTGRAASQTHRRGRGDQHTAIGYNESIFCRTLLSRYKISEYMNHVYGNLSVKMILAKSAIPAWQIGLSSAKSGSTMGCGFRFRPADGSGSTRRGCGHLSPDQQMGWLDGHADSLRPCDLRYGHPDPAGLLHHRQRRQRRGAAHRQGRRR